jgi:hypothetical protein
VSARRENPAEVKKRKKSILWGFEAPRERAKKKRERDGTSVRFSEIDLRKFNNPPTHARDDEAFSESSEVRFVLVFFREHVCRIADTWMVLQINVLVLDSLTYRIFSYVKMAKVLGGTGFGPIYASLVVVVNWCWFGGVVHVEVAEDVTKVLSYSCCFIGGLDLCFT